MTLPEIDAHGSTLSVGGIGVGDLPPVSWFCPVGFVDLNSSFCFFLCLAVSCVKSATATAMLL